MVNNKITVSTAAQQVALGSADRPLLLNTGATILYIGNTSGVTSANGIPLAAGTAYEFPNTLEDAAWDALWVISSAGGGELRFTTVG